MEVKKISKYVGHDGKSYFCWNCGKAGFDKPSQVNGHQSECSARQVSVTPTITPTTTPIPTYLGGGGGGGTPPIKQEMETLNSDIQIAMVRQELADMKAQYSKVFNEIPHQQAVQHFGFLGLSNNQLIFLLVTVVIGYMIGHESSCQCDVSAGIPKRRLGSSIKDKVTDKAINYGINKLFK